MLGVAWYHGGVAWLSGEVGDVLHTGEIAGHPGVVGGTAAGICDRVLELIHVFLLCQAVYEWGC